MTNAVISRFRETVSTRNIILQFKKADGLYGPKDSRNVPLKDNRVKKSL